jgi:hypothetical protein
MLLQRLTTAAYMSDTTTSGCCVHHNVDKVIKRCTTTHLQGTRYDCPRSNCICSTHRAIWAEKRCHLGIDAKHVTVDATAVAWRHRGCRGPYQRASRFEMSFHLLVHDLHIGAVLLRGDRCVHLGADVMQPPIIVDHIKLFPLHPLIDTCPACGTMHAGEPSNRSVNRHRPL